MAQVTDIENSSSIAGRLRKCAFNASMRLTGRVRSRALPPLVRRLLRSLGRAVDAADVHVFLVRHDSSNCPDVGLRYEAGFTEAGRLSEIAERFAFALLSPSVRSSLQEDRTAWVVRGAAAGGRLLEDFMERVNCQSYLMYPLHLNSRLRGILGIACRTAPDSSLAREHHELLKLNGAVLFSSIIRVRREHRRQRQIRQWKRIADQACDFALTVDESFVIRQTIAFGKGRETPQLDNLRLIDVIPSGFHRDVKQQIARAVRAGSVRTCSFQISLGCNNSRWYLARIEPAAGPRSGTYATLYLTDNNSDKLHEEQIRLLNEQLTRASRLTLLGEMSTEFAHQLNQPLQAMLNHCNTLQRRYERGEIDTPRTQQGLDSIEDSILHSADIIKSIREFVQFRTLHIEEVELSEIVGQAVAMVDPAVPSDGELVVPHDFGEVRVRVDRVQTIHVLVNLIVNAFDACSEIQERSACVRIQILGDSVHTQGLAIVDNGPGLPGENPEVVFEKFYTSKKDGVGLGLAVSRDICKSQGGDLTASNNADQVGCTFVASLPLAYEDDEETVELCH